MKTYGEADDQIHVVYIGSSAASSIRIVLARHAGRGPELVETGLEVWPLGRPSGSQSLFHGINMAVINTPAPPRSTYFINCQQLSATVLS
jgi:hypothetical protein